MSVISSNPTNNSVKEGMNPILQRKTLRLTEITLFTQGPINGGNWIQIQDYLISMPISLSCHVTLGHLLHLSKLLCFSFKMGISDVRQAGQ